MLFSLKKVVYDIYNRIDTDLQNSHTRFEEKNIYTYLLIKTTSNYVWNQSKDRFPFLLANAFFITRRSLLKAVTKVQMKEYLRNISRKPYMLGFYVLHKIVDSKYVTNANVSP